MQPSSHAIARVALLTDFGPGLYVGQMRARLDALLPRLRVIDLVADLPPFRPDLSAYLLPGLVRDMPLKTLYLCVVDPGVGGERGILLAQLQGSWYLAPDNGLLAPLAARDPGAAIWRIGWRPQSMSATFHGRDWIVPAAARLCVGQDLALVSLAIDGIVGAGWPAGTPRVLYVDRFGNLITGLSPPVGTAEQLLRAGCHWLPRARTFEEVAPGSPFWYENAFGLVEVAVNCGSAADYLRLTAGDEVGPLAVTDCGAPG